MTYISKTISSARLRDPASWSPFPVDETSPSKILTSLAVGVDRGSCLKIDSYGFNLTAEEVDWLISN